MIFGSLWDLVIKFGSIALLLVYMIFAVVITRQINLMVGTFYTPFKQRVVLLGWVHLGLAVGLLVLALTL